MFNTPGTKVCCKKCSCSCTQCKKVSSEVHVFYLNISILWCFLILLQYTPLPTLFDSYNYCSFQVGILLKNILIKTYNTFLGVKLVVSKLPDLWPLSVYLYRLVTDVCELLGQPKNHFPPNDVQNLKTDLCIRISN